MRHLPIYAFALFVPAVVASVLLPNARTAPSAHASVDDAANVVAATEAAHHHFAALSTTDETQATITHQHGNSGLHSHPALPAREAQEASNQRAMGDERLKGLWSRHDGREDGKQLRFYYFHDGGIGLYRYGRVGLNNTHSYTYNTSGQTLDLTFKKTGKKASTEYRIVKESGREVLLLKSDPYEPKTVKYYKEMGPMDHAPAPLATEAAGEPGFDRMWTHVDKFKNGGIEFSIYQFKAPALDGRGVGWHHRGDFDNWSTETLFYRRDVNGLSLMFPQRRERSTSKMNIATNNGKRTLSLDADPRNYWQASTYVDGGKAFAVEDHAHPHAGIERKPNASIVQSQWLHLVNHTADMQ